MPGMWSGASLIRPKAPPLASSPRMPSPPAPHEPHFSEPRRAGRTNRCFLLEPIALNYDDDEDLLGEDGARKRKWRYVISSPGQYPRISTPAQGDVTGVSPLAPPILICPPRRCVCRIEPKAMIASVVWAVTALPMLIGQTALAAVTGGKSITKHLRSLPRPCLPPPISMTHHNAPLCYTYTPIACYSLPTQPSSLVPPRPPLHPPGAIRGSVVPDSAREAPSRDSSRQERSVRPSERVSERSDRESMFSMERPRRAAAGAAAAAASKVTDKSTLLETRNLL